MTVLVGFVPTPEARAALDAGIAEAARRGEGVLVLNSSRGGAPVSVEVADEDTLSDIGARAEKAGVAVEIRQVTREGEVADEVLRVAREVDASVIVIGLRKRSPVGKLLMGSSAQRILLDADRPVLAVKP